MGEGAPRIMMISLAQSESNGSDLLVSRFGDPTDF